VIRLDSTEAELDALQQVCERLGGFDDRVTLEWLDGALAALLAGPSVPAGPEAVLEPLFGDAWERTFADPEDAAQALAALAARWRVLRSQLDPEALYEDDQALRLSPLLLSPAEGEPTEGFALGRDWAEGFLAVVRDPAWGWDAAAPDEFYEHALATLQALAEEGGAAADGDEREAQLDAAAFAAQDLRLWWIEHAPRTAPRRAEAVPGRNDPCPCGSGRKYKKCHGAA
jgi:uncharacterized protein